MYYEQEWDLICYMFDGMCESLDTPTHIIETAFGLVHDEYINNPSIPPTMQLIKAKNTAEMFRDKGCTTFSFELFDTCAGVIESVLYTYLQDILLIEKEKREDFISEEVATRLFPEEVWENIKLLYS